MYEMENILNCVGCMALIGNFHGSNVCMKFVGNSCVSNSCVKLADSSGGSVLWVKFVGQTRGSFWWEKLVGQNRGLNSWIIFVSRILGSSLLTFWGCSEFGTGLRIVSFFHDFKRYMKLFCEVWLVINWCKKIPYYQTKATEFLLETKF